MGIKKFFVFSLLATFGLGFCPPTGPALPPPNLSESSSLNALETQLNVSLDSPLLPWNATATSFSVQITSRERNFFEYHYTAPVQNSSGIQQVRGDTVYRAASITKVFTVLALMLVAGDKLDQPVSSYLPELSARRYGNVTLRMLAGQLSGTPRWGKSDLHPSS
jgi:CubicO group peptidase (beta-lactamase class C family)